MPIRGSVRTTARRAPRSWGYFGLDHVLPWTKADPAELASVVTEGR